MAIPKYQQVVKLFERRIQRRDYLLADLPSERKLAAEVGVSYMTARRAIGEMVSRGLLKRQENGRLTVVAPMKERPRERRPRRKGGASLNIAMVLPLFQSFCLDLWHSALNRVVTEAGGALRPITYTHEDDPLLLESLDAKFDGVFIIPPIHLSPLALNRLSQVRGRVVTIWHDLTHLGIPCITTGRSEGVDQLIEHLASLGHSRIDCLNTQPMDGEMSGRIQRWRERIDIGKLAGELHQAEVEPFGLADEKAYRVVGRMLDEGELHASALFCTTVAAAAGANRALYERGLRAGTDLALCTFDGMERARYMIPSLTTIVAPDPAPFLDIGLQWMRTGGRDWNRPLKIEPEVNAMKLIVGESTTGTPEQDIQARRGETNACVA